MAPDGSREEEHVQKVAAGASQIGEHSTVMRVQDRALPFKIKMFFANNFGKRSFAATDTKVSPGLFIP